MKKILKIEPFIEKFTMLFKGDTLTQLSIESGFVKRKPRKIDPRSFLLAFFITAIQRARSLDALATTLGILKGITISKQAIDQRIKEPLGKFLESTLAFTIARKINTSTLTSKFKRILVQDSSSIRLPSHLSGEFPGSKNGLQCDSAIMKITVLFDLLKEQFSFFSITPFTTNDQSMATSILDYIKEGDLLIRDLGYFVLTSFTSIAQKGAFFMSRFRHGVVIADPKTGKRLNLLKMLKKQNNLDITVLLGKKEQLTARLIAIPVEPALANERRRKLKKNRDRRLNPSKEHLALLGWNIFVLNVDEQTLTPEDIARLYGIRWRIEIIFKAWKSNFSFADVPEASAVRIRAYVLAFLIFITLFHTIIYKTYALNNQTNEKHISLFKLSKFFKEQLWAIFIFWAQRHLLADQIYYHCTYEKRSDRLNHSQKMDMLS